MIAPQDAEISRNLTRVVWRLFTALLLSLGGYYILAHADEFAGLLIGTALLCAFPAMVFATWYFGVGGKGVCPACEHAIEATFDTESIMLCRNCGTYLQVQNKKLSRLPLDDLASEPSFAAPLPWTDLGLISFPNIPMSANDVISDAVLTKEAGHRVLSCHWPMTCCVCGKSPRKMKVHKRVVIYRGKSRFYFRDKQITLVAQGIPYCDEHDNGACFNKVFFADSGPSGFGLLFRSLAYRNAFREMNPSPWENISG
jgi:hypothetical protein